MLDQPPSEIGSLLVTSTNRPLVVTHVEALLKGRRGIAHPKERYHTVLEGLAKFNEVRDRTIAAARERESKLFFLQAKHSRLGLLNGVELLRLAAAHTTRHAEQIRRARER